MRAFVVGSCLAVIASIASCTLTTDLGGLSGGGGADAADGAVAVPMMDAGPLPDVVTTSDAPSDTGPSNAYLDAVLADGPVAYYRFEDPSDTNFAKDEVGTHPANVTNQGATFGGDGVVGHGVLLDGVAALDIGDAFDFAGQVPFTLEIWVKATTSALGGHLLHKRDETVASDFKGYILYTGSAGDPHFEASGGPTLGAWNTDPLPAGFAHVVLAVSYDTGKGNARLYVNAQPAAVGGFDNVTDMPDTPQHLVIGRFFVGILDEAAIYAKALPPDRVLAHYRAGRP